MIMSTPLVLTLIFSLFLCEVSVVICRIRSSMLQKIKKQTYASIIGLSSIVTSALFTAVAGTLVLLTRSGDPVACEATILTCIFLYTATKFQLYLFFIERMYVVHRKPSETRVQCRLYIVNACLLIPYVVIIVLMVVYRVSFIDSNNVCRIGLHNESALPLIVYDTIFSAYSVAVFVWPLFMSKSNLGSTKLLRVAKKNAIGTFVSTISSFLNIFSLYWESELIVDSCLMFCAVDVMVNVLVMNYLISGGGKKRSSSPDDTGVTQFSAVNETSCSSTKDKSSSSKVHPTNPVRLVSSTCLSECLTEDELPTIDRKSIYMVTSGNYEDAKPLLEEKEEEGWRRRGLRRRRMRRRTRPR